MPESSLLSIWLRLYSLGISNSHSRPNVPSPVQCQRKRPGWLQNGNRILQESLLNDGSWVYSNRYLRYFQQSQCTLRLPSGNENAWDSCELATVYRRNLFRAINCESYSKGYLKCNKQSHYAVRLPNVNPNLWDGCKLASIPGKNVF